MFTEILKEDYSKLVNKNNRVIEGYALNYVASLEFFERAGIEVDKKAFEEYLLQKCIPMLMDKICVALDRNIPCVKEFKIEHLGKIISDISDEKILQHITFISGAERTSQCIAFSAKFFKDSRLKKLFPSSQINKRCRFVSPKNLKDEIWFLHKRNKDHY